MNKKRGSPKLSRPGRADSRSSSFMDKYPDEERQHLLLRERALSRKLSYKPEVNTWPPQKQIEYLLTSASGREWGIVGDLLQELLGTEEEDPLHTLLVYNAKEFTDVVHWAAEDGEERVVKLLTERSLVEVQSATYQSSFHKAAELGHASVVKLLLKHCRKNSPDDFRNFVNAGDDTAKARNTALHYACSKEHFGVIKELLDESYAQELDLNVRNGEGDTPLHVAVTSALRTTNLEIIDILCSKAKQKKLLMNKKNKEDKTPYQRLWEVSMNTDNEEIHDTAELIKQMFLKQKPVNDRRDDYYRERDYLQNVATSLLVGATLLVSVAFGGFLQMPKLPPAEDFLEPGSTTFNADSDLGSRKYWYIRAIDIFRCSNAISFFMSIISIVASIRVMISRRDKSFIEREVCTLERSIRVGSITLTLATAVAVVAFVSSGLANIPVAESGWSRVVSHWGRREYMPLLRSTTLTTCILGSMFVGPIVVLPLAKDYYFFWQDYRRDMSSVPRFLTLLFATALIFTVTLLVILVVFGMGLL